jgi:SAM-dependent methyltransferase
VCLGKNLKRLWDFGFTPLANSYLDDLDDPETHYPLVVNLCSDCSQVQLAHVINPKALFSNYLYTSSTSPVFIQHFVDFAKKKGKKKFVIDIGGNDGILLRPFANNGSNVLNIEPAKNIKSSVPVVRKFFNAKVAKEIEKKHGKADLITATNVFAHIDDLEEVISGVKLLLTPRGEFVVEAPYLGQMLKEGSFDLIYHEHLSYWSIAALDKLFTRHNMIITEVEHTKVHGGSIRVTVSRIGKRFLYKEKLDFSYFEDKLRKNRASTLRIFRNIKELGLSIAGYGAPAKATTLMHYFGLRASEIDFIVDDSPLKVGKYMPGSHIPIASSDELYQKNPDYVFILAWNFAEPIIKKLKEMGYSGKCIVPFP